MIKGELKINHLSTNILIIKEISEIKSLISIDSKTEIANLFYKSFNRYSSKLEIKFNIELQISSICNIHFFNESGMIIGGSSFQLMFFIENG